MVAPVLAAFLPADITAIVIATDGGNVLLNWAAVGVTLLIGLKLAWRFSRTRLQLDPTVITEHGAFRLSRRATADRVASAALLTVYDNTSLRRRHQLFLLDADGRTLLRMRGEHWSDAHMRTVSAHFDVPVSESTEPVTTRELRRQRGDQLSWRERHPTASAGLLLLAGLASCGAIAVLGTMIIS